MIWLEAVMTGPLMTPVYRGDLCKEFEATTALEGGIAIGPLLQWV